MYQNGDVTKIYLGILLVNFMLHGIIEYNFISANIIATITISNIQGFMEILKLGISIYPKK